MSTLTVCSLNVHKCKGSDGVTNEARTGDVLVKVNADVYALNEVYYYWGAHSGVNMATYLRDYLQQRLGGTWHVEWVNARDLSAVKGYGSAILSRIPLAYVKKKALTPGASNLKGGPRAVIKANIQADRRTMRVFATHLEYYDDAARTKEIHELGVWCGAYPIPHVLMGDCNTRPGSADYKRIVALGYRDGWSEAKAGGIAASPWPSGNTHGYNCPTGGGSRFDYVWVKGLTVTQAQVFDMRVNGVWPSDHHPLKVWVTV